MSHVAFAPSARLVLPRRLLLKAAHHHEGMYSKSAGYYLLAGRWHKLKTGEKAPKGAPVAAHPQAAGQHLPSAHFTDEQWAALKLPDSNVNAPSYNNALDKLKAWSDAGNVTAIVGAGYGVNTYGKNLAKVANHLLGLHGSPHKVVAGQKAGEHTAVQSGPTEAHPSGLPEHLAPKTTPGLQEPGGMSPLAQHIKDSLDKKAADGDVEFIKLVAANNPKHPQIVAYAKQKLAELGGKPAAPPAAPPATPIATPAAPSLPPGAKLSTNVSAAPLVHTTTPEAAAAIQKDGFKPSGNSMYGKGVYFSSAAQSGAYGSAVLGAKLKPHKQLTLVKDSDVSKAFTALTGLSSGHLGSDKGAKAMIDAGVGSMVFPVDGETYTVVFDPGLIDVQTNATSGPLTMPDFQEGKTTTGVKAYYEKQAKKVIDHGLAGNVAVLEGMKDVNGKSWQGKTANSKKLLALHKQALAYAKGGAAPSADASVPGATSAPATMPAFDTYSDAKAWAQARAKEQGLSWQAYTATPEYKGHVHPALAQLYQSYKAGFDAESEATGKKLQAAMSDAGVKPGDTVSWTQVGQFLSQSKMAGVVKLGAHGIPYVHLDHEVAVSKPGGKIGYAKKLRWQPYMKASAQVDTGPKEGDTKPAADGGTLVLKDGHWVKQGGDEAAAVKPEHFEVSPGDVFKLDSQYQKMNAGEWVVYNISADGAQIYMHKVGAKVPNQTNSATIPAATLAEAVAKGTAKKQPVLSTGGVVDGPLKGWSIGAKVEALPKEKLQRLVASPGSPDKVKAHAVAVLAAKHGPDPAAAAWNTLTTDQKASILALVSPLYTTGYTGKPNAAAKKMAAAGWGALTDHVKSKVTPYISMHAHAKQEAAAKPAPVMPEKPVAAEPVADNDQSPLKTIGGITFEAVKSGAVWKVKVAGTDKLIDGIHSDSKGGLWSKLSQHHGSVGADSFASEFGGKTETQLSAQQLQNLQSIPWFKLKLPPENTNAKSHNAAISKIEAMAFAGDKAGLQAFIDAKAGAKQTYAKKQVLTAQTALAGLQVLGATAAVAVEPAPAVAPAPAASDKITSLTRKQVAGLHGWLQAGQPTSKHPDSWSNLWKKLSSNMKAAVKAEMKTDAPPAAKPPVTADTPLTQLQKDAVDAMSINDLHVLAGDGQPLPPNVKVAVKKKLAEKQAAATPKPVSAPKTILHNTMPGHSKSWSVYVTPNASGGFDMVTEYGKIGGTQQKTVKSYATAGEANTAAIALKNEKFKKGYVQQPTDFGHVVPAPGSAAQPSGPKEGDTKQGADGMLVLKDGHWVKVDQGPKALTLGDVNNLKAATAGHSKKEFEAVLKPAAMAGDAAAIHKWKAENAHKMPNTQKLADKLLEAMGAAAPAPAADGGAWEFDASNMGFGGAPTLLSEVDNKLVYIAKTDEGFQFGAQEIDSADAPDDYQDHEFLSDAVAALQAKGFPVPPVDALKKLDPAYQPSGAAKPAAPASPAGGMPSMDNWTQVGGQGGSNPGGKFKDPTGQEWYCKWPSDPEAIASEVLAAKLYALAGLSSQDCMVVTKGGKPAIATKWVNIKKAGTAAALAKTPGALDGFAVDAWLGNWDVVGMSLDNLQIGPDGKAHRVDAGGSLEYRAKGEKKPFGPTVDELTTLRDKAKNPHAAAVFGGIKDADITAGVAKVLAISDAAIKSAVMQHGPGTAADKQKLIDTLLARKNDLAAKYPKAAKKAKLATFKIENISKPPSFTNWNNSGKGLSSVPAINEANEEAVNAAYAAAIRGDLDKIKSAQAPVFDKATHAVTGHTPLSTHPSQHVKAYWSDLVNEVDLQLNPPQMPEIGTVVLDDDMAAISAALKPVPSGKTVAAVEKSQKIGDYILLGKYGGARQSIISPKADDSVIGSEAWKSKAKAAYNASSSAAKGTFSTYVSTSGARALNTALRNGDLSSVVSGKTVAQHVKDFQGLLVDIPPGSTFVRRMGMHGYGSKPNEKKIKELQQFLLSAESGSVIQEPGFSSTSWTGGNKILSNNDIEWHFTASKGVKMFPGWLSANSGEGEGLLPPNQRYMITKATKSGKTVHVHAVLLPTV